MRAWVRISVPAAVAAAVVTIAFDLLVAERVDAAHRPVGLALAELVFALGAGLGLAGAATLLAVACRRPTVLWLGLVAACLWAMAILPAIKYPPLPPGIESPLAIGERQLAHLGMMIAGFGGAVAAGWTWIRGRARSSAGRTALALAAILTPAVVAFIALPGQGAAASADPSLVPDFRVVALAGQVLFWLCLAGAGTALLAQARR